MSTTCTDTSNEEYQNFWLDYFISIGYIDSSGSYNSHAPYGKCTSSLLWITYLINLVHFFLLSSGILYLFSFHQNKSGNWWPFMTWILSFICLIIAIIFFILWNLNINVFSILIIAFQLSTLIILWISIFIVFPFAFTIEYRYQRCLFLSLILLLLIQIGCLIIQTLITLHCIFNLKFVSTSLDYGYWSAIIAAIGTIVSTLLLDHIFIWCRNQQGPTRVSPVSPNQSIHRPTSPLDPAVLADFQRHSEARLHHIYSNKDGTRHFRIIPGKQHPNGARTSVARIRSLGSRTDEHKL
ncbi:unnamed protein product [Rotaria sordida]|uniref:Uncharacterized protein n=1 Tax=Rotaria sordida TaxID=392033 RepID=A0A814VQX5_9BILA|nr:unnamed protein product [Rotaria sordida]CAF1074050.1 unnamed protein product [Rotaria sordida]CAF1194406.1 unnamed protein product [Rotaria sordida]CAF1262154.1 unnamed protein product [Rotaria sordida]CAF3792048.1 unnamed protein product [Rotaria sordida]